VRLIDAEGGEPDERATLERGPFVGDDGAVADVGLLSGILIELALSFLVIHPRHRLRPALQYLPPLFPRGQWVTASGAFNYIFHNADNIVVGRLLGIHPLGVYQMAYSLSIIAITEIADV
jgi:O-antigen/teichoic acid export membrane protein